MMTKVLKVIMITADKVDHLQKYGDLSSYKAPTSSDKYTSLLVAADPVILPKIQGGTEPPIPDPDPVDPDYSIPTPVEPGDELNLLIGYELNSPPKNVTGFSFILVDKKSLKEVKLESRQSTVKTEDGKTPVQDSFFLSIPKDQPKGLYFLKIEMLYKLEADQSPTKRAPYMPLIEVK